VRYKTGHDPVENARQEKMSFVDAEKFIHDGAGYVATYEPSGIVTCAAPEDEIKIPEPGSPGWVSYNFTYALAKPAHDIKIRNIKISPHSKTGKALVKKS
jgi:hypothetical protein